MTFGGIKSVAKDYRASFVALAVLAIGVVAVVVTQQPDNAWQRAQIRSQHRFERHLQVIEAQASAASARDLAQQAASDRQAAAQRTADGAPQAPASTADSSSRAGSRAVAQSLPRPRQEGPSAISGPAPGPTASGSYVDCSRIGHTVSISDPAGDLQTLYHPELAAKFPSVDLTTVRVAVAGDTLCVDFGAKGPPDPSTFYIFELGSPTATTGPSLGIDVIFWASGARQVALNYPGDDEAPYHGIVSAAVGTTGSSTSLLIDRRVFPGYVPSPPWSWSAEGVGWTGLREVQQVTDTDPATKPAAYP